MKATASNLKALVTRLREISASLQRLAQQAERIVLRQARVDERDAVTAFLLRMDEDPEILGDLEGLFDGPGPEGPDDEEELLDLARDPGPIDFDEVEGDDVPRKITPRGPDLGTES